MVATVFCGDRSDGPYLRTFCRQLSTFPRDGGCGPHDDRNDAKRSGQRKTTQTPHPSARDGSGIPVPRDRISVASLGPFGASYTLASVVVPAYLAACGRKTMVKV